VRPAKLFSGLLGNGIWTFDKLRSVTETAVLENKRLGGLLALIRQDQQAEPPGQRTRKGPKRRDQAGHMFSVG
jgi:hypothetical protein